MTCKSLLILLFGWTLVQLSFPVAADAATVTIPTDHATVQSAVNAVQGTSNATVIINSDATFVETVTITQSVTIEAGAGYAPIIRGAVADAQTIYFNPTGASSTALTLDGLTLLPESSPAAGNNIVVEIVNAATAPSTVVLEGLTINDPDNLGPQGIYIRSITNPGSGIAPANNVDILNSTITLGGVSGVATNAVTMTSEGTLSVSGVEIHHTLSSGTAFYIWGSQSSILFTLEDSTISVTAPNGAYMSQAVYVGNRVTATIERNTFNLIDTSLGFVRGISTGTEGTAMVINANRFIGSGPEAYLALIVSSKTGGLTEVYATNNVLYNIRSGIVIDAQTGSPGGNIGGAITNNTFDNISWAVEFYTCNSAGCAINLFLDNNIYSNCAVNAVSALKGSGSTLTVATDYNLFFNNTQDIVNLVKGANSATGDPMYTGGNFSPGAGSAAIDAGSNSVSMLTSLDLLGNNRTQDGDGDGTAVVDMGAVEYVAGTDNGGGGGGGGGGGCFITAAVGDFQ
jgi:hypothetical protein